VDFLEDDVDRHEHRTKVWDQREELRAAYEDVHGTDRALWPVGRSSLAFQQSVIIVATSSS
jgi:hypothetical protein